MHVEYKERLEASLVSRFSFDPFRFFLRLCIVHLSPGCWTASDLDGIPLVPLAISRVTLQPSVRRRPTCIIDRTVALRPSPSTCTMGQLVYHEWARLLALSSAGCECT